MAKHNETGIKGEQIAENFLLNLGMTMLERNWRHGKKEVDLIFSCGETLILVEVKTRSSFDFGFPEEAVNPRKQAFLKEAAAAYFDANPNFSEIRFDIVSVLVANDHIKEILHFEDAFY
ncbi:YraN family protein [Taibaiella soli]|uniref:UPF0102 protein DN068_20810 n=1 Tax=Taibaiella soli TaxID=1649169 RepID=A0A2W2A6I2_9BACT|nr:YraN family protein [Taibaiella soli]PZF70871.1 YraN family protein [Taibaiella soli]